MSNVQTDTVAQMGQYSHKISAIAIDFETVSLSLIKVDHQKTLFQLAHVSKYQKQDVM